MNSFQVCARCSTRWPLSGAPGTWCPNCHGVLLSPTAPGYRRNFAWVARKPGCAPWTPAAPRPPAVPVAARPTPRYDYIPRWGLTDVVRTPEVERSRIDVLAGFAPRLLIIASGLFIVAALAEIFRYALLVYNRTRLVEPLTLAASDAFVWIFEVSAPIIAASSAVAATCWLIRTRAEFFAEASMTEPRSHRTLLLGCLIPGVNLVMPGVFLTELATMAPLPQLRMWWASWVASGVLVAVNVLVRRDSSLQAQANSVEFAALAAIVGSITAVLTLLLIRGVEQRNARVPKRLVLA